VPPIVPVAAVSSLRWDAATHVFVLAIGLTSALQKSFATQPGERRRSAITAQTKSVSSKNSLARVQSTNDRLS